MLYCKSLPVVFLLVVCSMVGGTEMPKDMVRKKSYFGNI
jgi:hypothetical protein